MQRLSVNLHPFFNEAVINTLSSKQVLTISDFLRADSNDLLKTTKIGEILVFRLFCHIIIVC